MQSVIILFITELILDLKSGNSLNQAEENFKDKNLKSFLRIQNKREENQTKWSCELIELELILSRGRLGYPVMRSLLSLRQKVSETYLISLDRFIQKTPFLAMLPLFLFYFPALILVFIGPFIKKFLSEVSI